MSLIEREAEGTMDIWQQIDAAERYLVSGMFKEASSRASSVIRLTHITTVAELQLDNMRESAGMVVVQSMKELGRTLELFIELQILFGSVAEIPVQVFLTAVCMHISEGLSSSLGSIFEEFLSNWAYSEGEGCAVRQAKPHSSSGENMSLSVIPAEKYLEVAEVYAITFLGTVSHNPETAISWTEKALLPEGNRQDMLRRLRLMRSVAKPRSIEATERNEDPSATSSFREGLSNTSNPQSHSNRDQLNSTTGKSILPKIDHMSERINPCLGWFRTVRLQYGNVQLVVPRGKTMLMGLLLFFAYSIYRQRSAALKQTIARQVSSVKKVLTDAWQLAFSVNVNPLAAVQQLPSASHGSSYSGSMFNVSTKGEDLKQRRAAEGAMDLWQQIAAAVSYLISCMFKEAASQAPSIIRHTHITTEAIGELQLDQKRKSAGMLFCSVHERAWKDIGIVYLSLGFCLWACCCL